MDLGEDGHHPVLQAFDEVQLPERLRPVQRPGVDALHEVGQLTVASRFRQCRPAHVEVDVEVGVIGPHGPGQSPRNEHDLLTEPGHEVLPGGHHPDQVVEGHPLTWACPRVQDRNTGDVHVHDRSLQVEERGVLGGEADRRHGVNGTPC